jgi:3-hydroxypropanoate dehydrogenase
MSPTENVLLRSKLSNEALAQLFREARTLRFWLPRPVPEALLRELYDLTRLGPTSANSSPARFVFVVSAEGKARLLPTLDPGNVEKTRAAPVTVIVAYDTEFYEKMGADWRSRFLAKPEIIEETAFRNGTLEGGYLIMAARALGLDCGPMSGFNAEKVNQEFFPDGKWKADFLCNIGYGDRSNLPPRAPRLDFDEACRLL